MDSATAIAIAGILGTAGTPLLKSVVDARHERSIRDVDEMRQRIDDFVAAADTAHRALHKAQSAAFEDETPKWELIDAARAAVGAVGVAVARLQLRVRNTSQIGHRARLSFDALGDWQVELEQVANLPGPPVEAFNRLVDLQLSAERANGAFLDAGMEVVGVRDSTADRTRWRRVRRLRYAVRRRLRLRA